MFRPAVYPSWRSAREQVVRYGARRPEETPLYRVVYHYREQLEYCWEELFSERYGVLQDEVLRAFERYLDCGSREDRFQKLLENNFEPLDSLLPARAPSQSWARCMKLVFEVDPLICPKCGSTMKIKSVIDNPHEIERLCTSLGLVSGRDPPELWHRGQGQEQIWLDDSQDFSQIH